MTSELMPVQCPRASPSPQREHLPVLFNQHYQRPSAAVSDKILLGVSDNELDDSLSLAASDAEELSGDVTDPSFLPSSASRNTRLRADEELIRVMTKAVNELGLRLRSHLAVGWMSGFFLGAIRPSANARPPSSSKYTTSSQNRSAPPYSSRIRSSASAALKSVDGAEEKGYEHLPPLDENVVAHLCTSAVQSHICTRWTRLPILAGYGGLHSHSLARHR